MKITLTEISKDFVQIQVLVNTISRLVVCGASAAMRPEVARSHLESHLKSHVCITCDKHKMYDTL